MSTETLDLKGSRVTGAGHCANGCPLPTAYLTKDQGLGDTGQLNSPSFGGLPPTSGKGPGK